MAKGTTLLDKFARLYGSANRSQGAYEKAIRESRLALEKQKRLLEISRGNYRGGRYSNNGNPNTYVGYAMDEPEVLAQRMEEFYKQHPKSVRLQSLPYVMTEELINSPTFRRNWNIDFYPSIEKTFGYDESYFTPEVVKDNRNLLIRDENARRVNEWHKKSPDHRRFLEEEGYGLELIPEIE